MFNNTDKTRIIYSQHETSKIQTPGLILTIELEEKHLNQTQALHMNLNSSFDKNEKSGAGSTAASMQRSLKRNEGFFVKFPLMYTISIMQILGFSYLAITSINSLSCLYI